MSPDALLLILTLPPDESKLEKALVVVVEGVTEEVVVLGDVAV